MENTSGSLCRSFLEWSRLSRLPRYIVRKTTKAPPCGSYRSINSLLNAVLKYSVKHAVAKTVVLGEQEFQHCKDVQ